MDKDELLKVVNIVVWGLLTIVAIYIGADYAKGVLITGGIVMVFYSIFRRD